MDRVVKSDIFFDADMAIPGAWSEPWTGNAKVTFNKGKT